jgi:hypothetical protein
VIDGLNQYSGQVNYGLRGNLGGENARWGVNPVTGQEEPIFGGYLLSDLMKKFGSIDAIKAYGRREGYTGAGSLGNDPGNPDNYDPYYGAGLFDADIDRFGTRPSNDTFSGKDGMRDLATIALMASAAFTGGFGLGGAEGAGAAAGSGAAEAGAYGADAAAAGYGTDAMAGGGMDWWTELGLTAEDVGMSSNPWTTDPSMYDLGGYSGMDTSGFGGDFSADAFGGQQYDMTGWGGSFDNPATLPNGDGAWGKTSWDLIKKYGSQAAQWLLKKGGPVAGAAQGASPLDTAMGIAPSLAAISYAKNQGPFDTSRFESLYDQYNPQALAGQFDQNTSLGRSSLESGIAARGLSGSTFGNDSLTNFNTARDIGRSELVSKGALGANSIAASILDAQIKERALKNDLYGRALYSIGSVFGGKR